MNSIIIISKQIFHQMESFIIDTDRLVNKIETENVYDNFSKNKEMIDFNNYSSISKYYDDLKILVVAK